MMIESRPRPSDSGKRPFEHNAIVLEKFRNVQSFFDQFERRLQKRKLIKACLYPKFFTNLRYHIFRKLAKPYPLSWLMH